MGKNQPEIEVILQSIEGMQRAKPDYFLFSKLFSKIEGIKNDVVYYSPTFIKKIMIASVVLVFVNGLSILTIKQRKQAIIFEQHGIKQLSEEYFETNELEHFW